MTSENGSPPAGGSRADGGAGAASAPATTRARRFGPARWVAWVWLVPALVLLGALVAYPIVYTLVRSFFDEDGVFAGAGNYAEMFSSSTTLTAVQNTVIWVVVAPFLVTVFGLVFAVLTERIRWVTVFKTIVFMPMAISFLASGVIFRAVYDHDPDRGVANAVVVGVHDTFAGTAGYPDARPRPTPKAPVAQAKDRSVATKQPVAAGTPVVIPLVGIKPTAPPEGTAPAKAAEGAGLSGTVWWDFTKGGGGKPDVIDSGEQGLPGITVEAVDSGGKVVGTTETAADGTFAFPSLTSGSYQVRLPADNFTAAYGGVDWLGPAVITPAIILAYLWVWAGFAMVLIAAGMAAMPRDVMEAARVDGASETQVFWRITVPLLMPVLTVVIVTMAINVLKVFDLIYIIAPEPSQDAATVLAFEMYRVSFAQGDAGLGSAIAVLLMLLVIPVMIFNVRRFRREQR